MYYYILFSKQNKNYNIYANRIFDQTEPLTYDSETILTSHLNRTHPKSLKISPERLIPIYS